MNASERKILTDLLERGDIAAALLVVKGAAPTTRSAAPPKPMRIKGAKRNKFAPLPALLAVAPCRCTLYESGAVQCHKHESARDPSVCLALIEHHTPAIRAHEQRLGLSPLTNWGAFIYQHASGYAHCETYK